MLLVLAWTLLVVALGGLGYTTLPPMAKFLTETGILIAAALMLFGLLSFVALALLILLLTPHEIGMWGALVPIYLLQGFGRSCYEGINKALYADMFPNDAAAAFSNIVIFVIIIFVFLLALLGWFWGMAPNNQRPLYPHPLHVKFPVETNWTPGVAQASQT